MTFTESGAIEYPNQASRFQPEDLDHMLIYLEDNGGFDDLYFATDSCVKVKRGGGDLFLRPPRTQLFRGQRFHRPHLWRGERRCACPGRQRDRYQL